MRPLARRLKAVLFPGAGVMHSSADELPEGCVLLNVFEHEIPMAEYVMLAVLLHVTGLRRHAELFARGVWSGNGRTGGETHGEALGKTIGILGYGHIGREICRRAQAFGMRVEAVTRRPEVALADGGAEPDFLGSPSSLAAVLARSDFFVIACPLTAQTRGLIGARQLALLRPGALLVNIARAEVVDEEALFEELRAGRISAALDVWYQYPLAEGESMHGSRLPFHELPNVLATPHFSAWSDALLERRFSKIAANLDRLARGEKPERVVLRGTWRSEA
jgi:phosphoglycerate dehydrogenase-like enzyme